jgi:L-lactate utilization protein LutB
MTIKNDEVTELRSRLDELEQQHAEMQLRDEVREVEVRSLRQEVALKAAYIEKLERVKEEIVAPKDVHIRNLEAIISQLQETTTPTFFRGNIRPTAQKSVISRLNRRKRD